MALQGQGRERAKEMQRWSGERLDSAKKVVQAVLPDVMNHIAGQPISWPAIYVGLIWAADQTTNGEQLDPHYNEEDEEEEQETGNADGASEREDQEAHQAERDG